MATATSTQTYKNHTLTLTITKVWSTSQWTVSCSWALINWTRQTASWLTDAQIWPAMQALIAQFKSEIDQAEANQNTWGTTWGTTGWTATWSQPFPTIVFWELASPPAAWPDYQITRNNHIAQQFYNQMITQVYTTWTQAANDYYQRLMSIVNSNWWNIQINSWTWEITSDNKEAYQNTSSWIRNKIWQLAWVGSWDQFALKTQWWTGTETGTGTGTGTGAWELGSWSAAADQTFSDIQNTADQMNTWLDTSFNQSLSEWQQRFANTPDFQWQITDRLTSMNTAFQTAAWNLKAAWDLEKKAQAIYSNENIAKMNQQLQQKWFDVSKAWPAVFFKAMKDRAQMSAEIYKLQADQEKTLATLETQRAQLVDGIKAAWMEADQWTYQQLNEITKQIENLRNNYDTQKMNVLWQYTLKPMLDVMSWQFEADFQNIVAKYQDTFLNANPSQKIVAAAKIFSNDWVYVSAAVALSANNLAKPFWEYLALCAESIRTNKIAAETQIAWAWASNINVAGWAGWSGWSAYA